MAIGALLFQSKMAVTVAALPRPACVSGLFCHLLHSASFYPHRGDRSICTNQASDKGLSHPAAQPLQSALA